MPGDSRRDCEIDFDEHILYEGRSITTVIGGTQIESPLCGLVTFNKHTLLEEMRKKTRGAEFRYGSWVRSEEDLKGYDLIIDATGLRVLLPKIQSHELRIPCVQYRVKYEVPPFDDYYLEIMEGMGGYLWYFPLGDGWAHVGAGDLNHGHVKAVESFFDRYGGEREKIVGRPIRLCPPRYCQPFQSGKVVGVGESIGTVFPLLGEGIIPTLECSELLVKNIGDLDQYRRKVLKKYAFYETAYNFLMPVFRGEIGLLDQANMSQAVFLHMLANQDRYGVALLQPTRRDHRTLCIPQTGHLLRADDQGVESGPSACSISVKTRLTLPSIRGLTMKGGRNDRNPPSTKSASTRTSVPPSSLSE